MYHVESLCRAEGDNINHYKLALHVMSAVWPLVGVQITIPGALRSRCAGCDWTWPIAKAWANAGENLRWWRQSSLYLTNAFPRSLKRADHWKQRERWKTVTFMCHSATQVCLCFIGGLYSFFVAQRFRALALLIMTSVQGRGYFQHTNTITQTLTNVARACLSEERRTRESQSGVWELDKGRMGRKQETNQEEKEKKDRHK